MSKQRRVSHPRILSVNEVKFGGDGKRKNKRYGWNVQYLGRVMTTVRVPYMRTVNLKTGAALKKPVADTYTETRAMSGVISRIVRRRSTLRKLGVL